MTLTDITTPANELTGTRALVTGGSRGIGAEIAGRLLQAGAQVLTTARSATDSAPHEATFVEADLTAPSGPDEVATAVQDTFGGVDIIVHNAGGALPHPGALAIPDEEWTNSLTLNLLAAVRLNALLAPGMRERRTGSIVHITSAATPTVAPPFLHYTVAKAGLENYSRGLALELAPYSVRVNAVSPGRTATPGGEATREEWARLSDGPGLDTTYPPLGRDGEPVDIANAVMFFVSKQATWITGSTLIVDGGEFPKG